MLRLLPLAVALGACAPIPIPITPPNLTATQDRAIRSTLSAASSTASSVSIPARPCPEHYARSEPGEQCKPIPCGGQCREDQRCDETAIVPRCVEKSPEIAGPQSH
ncbi:MAG TPA: hypothetical protein VFA20_29640 [Myxococcaceae bacterium]|nr:hypothetical protein [Myxococcaceae bacterium]